MFDCKLISVDHFSPPLLFQVFAIELQESFESLVESEPGLLAAARKAFQSYVRAYAAYGKDVKHVFVVRGLHLGHVAKSFGLKTAPSAVKVGGGAKLVVDKKGGHPAGGDLVADGEGSPPPPSHPQKKKRLRNSVKIMRMLTTSEFEAA